MNLQNKDVIDNQQHLIQRGNKTIYIAVIILITKHSSAHVSLKWNATYGKKQNFITDCCTAIFILRYKIVD